MKGKALAIQAGSHQCQQNGRGADQRHNPDAVAVRQIHQVCARVGDARTARLGNDTDIMPGQQWSKQLGHILGTGVFV